MSVFLDCRKHDKMIDKMLREKNKSAMRRAEEKKGEPKKSVSLSVIGVPMNIVDGGPVLGGGGVGRAITMDRYDVRMLLGDVAKVVYDGRSKLDERLNYERYRDLVAKPHQDVVASVRSVLLKQTGMTPTQEALQQRQQQTAQPTTVTQTPAQQEEDERKQESLALEYGIQDWHRRQAGKGERKKSPGSERELPDGYGDDEDDGLDDGDDDDGGDHGDAFRRILTQRDHVKRAREEEDDADNEKKDDSPPLEETLGPRERMARMLEQQLQRKAQRLDDDARRVATASSEFDVQLAVLVGSSKAEKKKEKKKKKKEKKEKKRK